MDTNQVRVPVLAPDGKPLMPTKVSRARRWVSGDRQRQVSVSDFGWKRLGQFTASQVQLLHRATGLLVTRPQYLSLIGV